MGFGGSAGKVPAGRRLAGGALTVWDDDVGTTTIGRVGAGAGALEPALELGTGSGGTELGLGYWMGWSSVLTDTALELGADGPGAGAGCNGALELGAGTGARS